LNTFTSVLESELIPYQAVNGIEAQSALVLAPHPDDEIFGCGGALALLAQAGVTLRVIIATDGVTGTDEEATLQARVRNDESISALGVVGVSGAVFWALPDRGVLFGEALVQRVIAAIKETDADLVFAPSLDELHPDHRAMALATLEAARRLQGGLRVALYEVSAPLKPNLLLDITSVIAAKRTAMQCFASQLKAQRYDEHIDALNRYRTYTLGAEVQAAEAFRLVKASDLVNGLERLYGSEYLRRHNKGLASEGREIPLVSVLVRSTGRTTLAETLDSIATQTYPNIEVVLVDVLGGGMETVKRCGNHTVVIQTLGRKLGRSEAANAALDAAHGELLLFLDDDDWIFPDHISKLVGVLQTEARCDVAYTGIRCVDPAGKPLGIEYAKPFRKARLFAGNFIPIHAPMFRRTLLKKGCRFDVQIDLYEDWDFWLQAAAQTPFQFVEGISGAYRISPNAGFGVNYGDSARKAASYVIDKWHARWSHDDLLAILEDVTKRFDLEREVAAADLQLRGAVTTIECRDAAIAAHVARRTELEQEVDRQSMHLTARAIEVEALRASIVQIQASTSWRLTAPLRGLISLLKGR
jgi:LmbE family N-acetylglucosaminyl deacetylase